MMPLIMLGALQPDEWLRASCVQFQVSLQLWIEHNTPPPSIDTVLDHYLVYMITCVCWQRRLISSFSLISWTLRDYTTWYIHTAYSVYSPVNMHPLSSHIFKGVFSISQFFSLSMFISDFMKHEWVSCLDT
jgi:uncharacterized membrane protein (DUF2068 family)